MKNILVLLLLVSCTIVRVYKTDPIRAQVDGLLASAAKTSKKMSGDLKEKGKVLKEVKAAEISNKKTLLKDLRSNLNTCKKVHKKFDGKVKSFKNEYMSLKLWEKKKIKSNEPDFEKVQGFVDSAPLHNKKMSEIIKDYEQKCKLFSDILKKSKIVYIEASTVKTQFTTALKKLSDSEKKVKAKIIDAKKKIKSSKRQNKKQMLDAVEQLEKILGKIVLSKSPIAKAVNSFHKKHGNAKKVLHGPGTAIYNDLEMVKKTQANLQIQINAFNQKAAELQAMADGKKEK